MIKVPTERDKSPKKWSLEFDLTKIKMFTREDNEGQSQDVEDLLLRIMGLYIETIVRYAMLYEKDILSLN